MLGVGYLLLCIGCGVVLCGFFFPQLSALAVVSRGEEKRRIRLPEFMVKLPAWYLVGTLAVSWLVYLVSYAFRNAQRPMFWGNLLAFGLLVPLLALYGLLRSRKKTGKKRETIEKRIRRFFVTDSYACLLYALLSLSFVTFLMFLTFRVADGQLKVGYSVFSDFAPHLGMIRSFSLSNNFPTQYAHFAGEGIRYHFMFQFMVGNLEYLGMRIDLAFNLPSIFGMVSVYLLLFVFAVHVAGSRLCAWITAFLFTFRSSFTLFRYLAEQGKGEALSALSANTEFLGYTQNENWGLWNLNVYCNQRHFAFALAVFLLAVLLFLPYLEAMGETLGKTEKGRKWKSLFFTRTAFGIKDVRFALGMGLVLGALAFWNGSVLIATLAVLFFMAALSQYRLDYLITAGTAVVLAFLEQALFVDGMAVSPSWQFGFLAEHKTLFGVAQFVVELTGFALVAAFAGACLLHGMKRYLFFVGMVPFVLAFTVSLTVDVTVNHKWIMLSLMLTAVYPAYLITALLKRRDWLKRVIAVLLLVVLTATGVYDYTIVRKRNRNMVSYRLDDPVTLWVAENATCEDLFLSPYYSLGNVVLGGAMLYYGWPYYAWSAGYDITERAWEVKRMYEAESPEELAALVEKNHIRYIIVDHDCRTSTDYDVREDVIESTYKAVFERDTGEWEMRIFDTRQRL